LEPKLKIYLVRHGETDWNLSGKAQGQSDIPLNSTGETQALSISKYFSPIDIESIYSSSVQRALKTASILSINHDTDPIINDNFLEIDFGSLDGEPLNEMRSKFPLFFKKWTSDPTTAVFPDSKETLGILQSRTWKGITELVEAHDENDNIVVVSHAFAIYSILCRALDMPLKNYGRLRLMPGTISVLEAKKTPGENFIDTKWTLTKLNFNPSQGESDDR